jgi:hypothetical protein
MSLISAPPSTLSSSILGKAATQHWRHIHMLRLTPTRIAYLCTVLQATMHASHRAYILLICSLAWQMSQYFSTRNVPDADILPLAESDGAVPSTNKSSLPINDTCPSHIVCSILTPPERGLHVACAGVGVGVLSEIRFREASVKASVRKLRARVYFLICRLRFCGRQTGARVLNGFS